MAAKRTMKGTIGVACLMAVAVGAGGPAAAQTLEESLANTYLTNPQLQAERARLRATDEQVPQALSGWRPQVTASAGYGIAREHTTVPGFRQTEHLNPLSGSVTVSQPLYRGGRTVANTERALFTVQAQRAQVFVVEQQVLQATAQAYMNLYRNMAVVQLNANNIEVLKRQLEAAQDRFRVGEVTRTDVAQAESRLARAVADKREADGNVEAAKATFERIVGLSPIDLSFPKRVPKTPATRDDATRLAQDNNPQIVAARFNELAARSNVRSVTGELLPTVTLEGSFSYNDEQSNKNQKTNFGQVLGRVSVPLYEAGSTYSRVREAKQTAGQRRIDIETNRRSIVEQASSSWDTLVSARARIEALRENIRAASIALDGVQQEAAVGSRTVLDILDAEQELFNARVNLVSSQRDEIVGVYTLTAATGRLTARLLGLAVELYDMDAYYESVKDKWLGLGDPLD
ncbi:MAG: TolC family outer membrane protein [Alphaproteobacteria bacterium]|nr:TolC family outer membrane protein [Alphaproteobacteria bacterium]